MSERTKVLVAESDEKAALTLLSALRDKGWDVVSARDAASTMSAATKERPDVVVLSQQLNGGGGLTTVRRLRCSAHTVITPVIVLTGSDLAEKRELQSAGAEECIERAASRDAVCAAVSRRLVQPTRVAEPPATVIRSAARLAALEASALLDSPREEAYDRVTRLAMRLMRTPAAAASFVAADRQFLKSEFGLTEPWSSKRALPLSHSICKWVVAGREQLVVADVRQHPVLRGSLAVRDLGVVAYAGVPLSAPSGEPIGSLCVLDTTPHLWTEDEMATLRDLARMTEAYAALEQSGVGRTAAPTSPTLSEELVSVVLRASGILAIAAANILRRSELRPGDPAHSGLLDVLERQGQSLVQWGFDVSRAAEQTLARSLNAAPRDPAPRANRPETSATEPR